MIDDLQSLKEAKSIIKNVDKISLTVCNVIDVAQAIWNSHEDPIYRKAASQCYSELSSFISEINKNPLIAKSIQNVIENKEIFNKLTREEKMVCIKLYNEFIRDGVYLSPEVKDKVMKLQSEIDNLGNQFQMNIYTRVPFFELPKDIVRLIPPALSIYLHPISFF